MASSSKFKFPQTPAPTRSPSPMPEIIKIVLREYAQLSIIINDNFNSTIHFGFDYYMYFDSKKNIKNLKPAINEVGLSCFKQGE